LGLGGLTISEDSGFGRVRGIPGEFSHLSNKLGVDFKKFGDLFFQSGVFNLQVGNLLLL